MSDGYDAKSCNSLQRVFYRPVEAAIRWCGLIAHEDAILAELRGKHIPDPVQFPQWRCLRVNTERIFDAIEHKDLTAGRDGKLVPDGEHIAPNRITVRHADLRAWLEREGSDRPAFLFDEVERSTHGAITVKAFTALQADRDVLKARIDRAADIFKEQRATIEAQAAELERLRAELAALEAAPSPAAGDAMRTTERNTLLKMVHGMASMAPFKFDKTRRNGAAKAIEDATAQAGCPVTEETALKWLRVAADQVG